MDNQDKQNTKSFWHFLRSTLFHRLLAMLLIVVVAAVAYLALVQNEYHHTALMFVGLPTVLALALVLTPVAKTITGGIVQGITLAMLVSAMFLGEGVVCIIMASPLFYLIGISIGRVSDERKKNKKEKDSRLSMLLLPTLLLVSSLEGVNSDLSFNREEVIRVQKIIHHSPQEIEDQLLSKPDFATELPLFFQLGFPVPTDAEGEGLSVGDQRRIYFKMRGKPATQMTFQVVSRTSNSVQFSLLEDQTKISSWLLWRDSTVSWQAISDDQTLVSWSLSYRRNLDPYWYFAPLMRYGVELAATYLLDEMASPHD